VIIDSISPQWLTAYPLDLPAGAQHHSHPQSPPEAAVYRHKVLHNALCVQQEVEVMTWAIVRQAEPTVKPIEGGHRVKYLQRSWETQAKAGTGLTQESNLTVGPKRYKVSQRRLVFPSRASRSPPKHMCFCPLNFRLQHQLLDFEGSRVLGLFLDGIH